MRRELAPIGMRVALLNLRYSPNLGDVLLCECLEYGLRAAVPGLDVLQLDITGRRAFSTGSKRRLAALAMLQRMPQAVRHRIARVVLGRSLKLTVPYWHSQLSTADAAVLGGGNLFADADLNFPLKVAAVMGAVATAGLPAAVHAVGVSDNWSRDGERLFRSALTGVKLMHAAVRDDRSREIWIRRLGPAGVLQPQLARDPGLLAAKCYPVRLDQEATGKRVGLCVTHPVALRYHADEPMPSVAVFTEWFAALVNAFTKSGWTTLLFSTGSAEDEAYLDDVAPRLLAAADPAGTATREPRFPRAADLAGFISGLDLVTAHRLHACVAAYSYGIPHVGFTWDVKMQSFFESVGRSSFLCAAVTTTPTGVISLAEQAIAVGIDQDKRGLVVAQTQTDIAVLLASLNLLPT